jgi:hypothetical protein
VWRVICGNNPRQQKGRELMLIDITLPLVGTFTVWTMALVFLTIGLPMLVSISLIVMFDKKEKAGN